MTGFTLSLPPGWLEEQRAGVAYCGVLARDFDGAALTATVTVTVVAAPGDVAEIAWHLRPIEPHGEDKPWRVVEQVNLPHVGTVTRTRGVEDVSLPDGGGWARSALLQTFAPFPGAGRTRVALITGSTSVLPLTAEMHDVFEAITATFRFTV